MHVLISSSHQRPPRLCDSPAHVAIFSYHHIFSYRQTSRVSLASGTNKSRNLWYSVAAAAAAAVDNADPSLPTLEIPSSLAPGDLLRCHLLSGQDLYLEVTKTRQAPGGGGTTLEALCEGEILKIHPNGTIEHAGFWPRLSDSWVKSHPTLQAALKILRKQQQEIGTLPSDLLTQAQEERNFHKQNFEESSPHRGAANTFNSDMESSPSLKAVEIGTQTRFSFQKISSLSQVESTVASNPSSWCDGTAPGDSVPTPEQTALLSAGELTAFLLGLKGVVLVQLELPFVAGSPAPFPLLRPFVLRLLQRSVENKGVVVLPSTAPGGGAASLVLAAKQQPFKAWGGHLAGIGVQAALVADSPFYKMLVGKILGYRDENIKHHIESQGQRLDSRVVAAVEAELAELSGAPPQLPWTTGKKAAK